MHSRARMHHVAVLTGKFDESNFPSVSSGFSATLVTKFRTSLTPGDNIFLTSSSSFNLDCDSREARALGKWDSLCSDDDDASCSSFCLASNKNLPNLTCFKFSDL